MIKGEILVCSIIHGIRANYIWNIAQNLRTSDLAY